MNPKYTVKIFLQFIILLFPLLLTAQQAAIYGIVTEQNNSPVDLVNVSLKGYPIGTTTNPNGEYLLSLPAEKKITIIYSRIGYQTIEYKITAKHGERIEHNQILSRATTDIEEVLISETRNNGANIVKIDPQLAERLPDMAGGGIEGLIKTLPGVSSNNELSSQYSVRGGNFDENLVYVNGIEIYRPVLIRSGQQEGMSFVNPDMVSSVNFSAGGFDAKYGDKMSSVLDITYKVPTHFGASASVSLLGNSLHFEGISKNKKIAFTSGIRHKTNRYILNTLDEAGDYTPTYIDMQTLLTYHLNEKWSFDFLGNISHNQYKFIPQTRETTFGNITQAMKLKIFFDGQEKDEFSTYLGAITTNFHPTNNLNIKLTASGHYSKERENYDIIGEYLINQLETGFGSESTGDSLQNLAIGNYQEHARNKMDIYVYNLQHSGRTKVMNHQLEWGLNYQREIIKNKINAWEARDSAGYSLPRAFSNETIVRDTVVKLFNATEPFSGDLSSNRLSAYLQDSYKFATNAGDLNITAGFRTSYWDYTNEFLFSPRISTTLSPEWEKKFVFRFSSGIYYQTPFFKELRDTIFNRNTNSSKAFLTKVKAQKSIHFVLGSDYFFLAWNRPFKLTSELYYKSMKDLIPYKVDNVRIMYLPDQTSKGFTYGLDFKINGEFVSGIQSWASLSFMKSMEDVEGDFDPATNTSPGYIPRPTDQRVNFSLFFQDYFPGNPSYRMSMTLMYGTGLPFGPPNSERYKDTGKFPSYRRVDIGLSKVLISSNKEYSQKKWFNFVKEAWLSFDVFNLLDINNTNSYFWVSDIYGHYYGVPNYLTGRKLNFKFTAKF